MRGKRWHVKCETIPQWKIVRRSRSIGISDRILHVHARGTWDGDQTTDSATIVSSVQFFAYCVQLTGHNSPDLRIGLAWHSIAIFSILQYRCYCVQLTGHNKKIVKKCLFNDHLTQNIKYRLTSYHIRHTVK